MNRSSRPNLSYPPAVVINVSRPTGLGIMRSLGRHGIPVIAIDSNPNAIGFFSRYCYQKILCNDIGGAGEVLFQCLRDLGKQLEKPAVLFPTSDELIMFISRYRTELDQFYRIPMPPGDLVNRIVDKIGLHRIVSKHRIPVPETFWPKNIEEVKIIGDRIHYPCILKPRYHEGFNQKFGAKVFLAHTSRELLARHEQMKSHGFEAIIQEVVEGRDDQFFHFMSYLDKDSQPLAFYTMRKIRQYPINFGNLSYGITIEEPEVKELGLRLLKDLRYHGISQIEFKRDQRSKQLKLIEINARSYAFNSLGEKCQSDLSLVAYLDMIGNKVSGPIVGKAGVTWQYQPFDLISSIKYIWNEDVSIRAALSNGNAKTRAFAIYDGGDLKPIIGFGLLLAKAIRSLI